VRHLLLSLALLLVGGACSEPPDRRQILALVDSRAEQLHPLRCLPSGRRELRAGLRRPTVCFANYSDGSAVWHRDQWGAVLSAARTWRWSSADSLRWAQVRDSVTALVVGIGGEIGGCSREVPASRDRLIAWDRPGEDLAIHSFEPLPGGPPGYALRFEVDREGMRCTLSSLRATAVYERSGSANLWGGDSSFSMETVLDSVARAAGLPVLRTAALPVAERELRLAAVGSGMVGQPVPLLRLLEAPYSVSGEVFFYWRRSRDSTGRSVQPDWVLNGQSGCRVVQSMSGWAACRVEVQPETRWPIVADSLQALGIWKLPLSGAPDHAGIHVSDQESVVGEVLVGDRYGRFEYRNLTRAPGEDLPRVRAAAALVGSLPAR
jgi:hypothetical protein